MHVIGADPFLFQDKVSGYFYAYATGDSQDNHLHFLVYRSMNLIDFEFVGYAYNDQNPNNWGKDWFWAPECYYNENNHLYYLFYGARLKDQDILKYFYVPFNEEACKLGVAVSKSPEGPFINITGEPLDFYPFDDKYLNVTEKYPNPFELTSRVKQNNLSKGIHFGIIDPNVFFEGDNIILYFSRTCHDNLVYDEEFSRYVEQSEVYAVKLDNSFWLDKSGLTPPTIDSSYIHVNNGQRVDSYIKILSYQDNPQEWENANVFDYNKSEGKMPNRRWMEGSTTFVREVDGEKYYCLTFSCNSFTSRLYSIGIAFAKTPYGPFEKYEENPIIHLNSQNEIWSTGHGSIVEFDGHTYCCHHGRTTTMGDRIVCLTEILNISPQSVLVSSTVKANIKKTKNKKNNM